VVPSDFSAALQGFTRLLGSPGEDGVFRFEPSPVDDVPAHAADDDAEVADWFATDAKPTIANPSIAQAPRVAQHADRTEAIPRQLADGRPGTLPPGVTP
jgi:hypothetical protein